MIRKFIVLSAAFFYLIIPWNIVFAENIRVAIGDNRKSVILKSADGLIIEGSAPIGRNRIVFSPGSIGSRAVRISSAGKFIQVNGKSYRGLVELRKKQNGLLLVINDLDIEDYLKGVVASEIPYYWEPEALKAQAVTSRTYALYRKRAAGKKPYHILATVDSQVYEGKIGERETTTSALRETEGTVIAYRGRVISAFYHSSCGGHTENASELWAVSEPYLQGVECECQNISRYGAWEKRISTDQIANALGRRGHPLKGISRVAINGITRAGRVKQVTISHSGGAASLPAEKFRAAVGYSSVPSVFFEVEMSGRDIVISGRGLGHGVGLCQWGAKEMAQRGHDYRSILAHYYPGTSVVKRESR